MWAYKINYLLDIENIILNYIDIFMEIFVTSSNMLMWVSTVFLSTILILFMKKAVKNSKKSYDTGVKIVTGLMAIEWCKKKYYELRGPKDPKDSKDPKIPTLTKREEFKEKVANKAGRDYDYEHMKADEILAYRNGLDPKPRTFLEEFPPSIPL